MLSKRPRRATLDPQLALFTFLPACRVRFPTSSSERRALAIKMVLVKMRQWMMRRRHAVEHTIHELQWDPVAVRYPTPRVPHVPRVSQEGGRVQVGVLRGSANS